MAIAATAALLLGLGQPLAGAAADDVPPPPAESGEATLTAEGVVVVVADAPDASPDAFVSTEAGVIALPDEFAESLDPGAVVALEATVPADVVDAAGVEPGSVVDTGTVEGAEAGAAVVDATGGELQIVEVAQTGPAPTGEAASPMAHSLDVVLLSYPGLPVASSATNAQAWASYAADYWGAETKGVVASVTVTVTSAAGTGSCANDGSARQWDIWAQAAAAARQVPPSEGVAARDWYLASGSGRHLVAVIPSGCSWGGTLGVGTIGRIPVSDGGLVIVRDATGQQSTLVHELGHNLGLGHANGAKCDASTLSWEAADLGAAGCTIDPYYDIYSAMGFGTGNDLTPVLTPPHREFLGGYAPGELVTVTGNTAQTITLAAADGASGVRAIKAIDPVSGAAYYLELRRGAGRDANTYYATGTSCFAGYTMYCRGDFGVRVVRAQSTAPGLDSITLAGPYNTTRKDFAMQAGERFANYDCGISVRVNSFALTGGRPATANVTVTTGTQAALCKPNDLFIRQAIRDFLGREATTAETNYWSGWIATNPRAGFIERLATSDEWVQSIVNRFYQDTLGRPGDANGVAFWSNQIKTGQMSVATVAAQFYSSNEYFVNIGGNTNATWVTDLYQKLLGRTPSTSERNYWVGQITGGAMNRLQVASYFYDSVEKRRLRVNALYERLLGRTLASTDSGYAYWADWLLTHDDIELAVVLATTGDEYYIRAQTPH
ncbi:MAG: DUF4214 domain-containing protein [Microbacteriaceae bacterium]|nr:DUF4214 domain-containing protein [Microbacteriaceae bacterium]